MIILYLDNKQVNLTDDNIKVTKENPYFKNSGSYTLDVNIPMTDAHNIQVMQSIHRMDVAKSVSTVPAMLLCDNHCVLYGTGIINNITDKVVKVQLVAGNSEINFLEKYGAKYIDEIEYPQDDIYKFCMSDIPNGVELDQDMAIAPNTVGVAGKWLFNPVYNESKDERRNSGIMAKRDKYASTGEWIDTIHFSRDTIHCIQPNLMYVVAQIVSIYGYVLNSNDLNVEPWNHIYIANARHTFEIRRALPHWTVKDFFTQFQNFLNCTIVFDDYDKTASIRSNKSYFDEDYEGRVTVVDDYSSDVDNDNDADTNLSSSNIKYSPSDSDYNKLSYISDDIKQVFERIKFTSYEDLVNGSSALTEKVRQKYIFECPKGLFVYNTEERKLNQIGWFEPLMRDSESDSYVELKICPVAMTDNYRVDASCLVNNAMSSFDAKFKEPILKSETKETAIDDKNAPFGIDRDADYNKYSEDAVWDAITAGEVTKDSDPEDRMQVVFIDDIKQKITKSDNAECYVYYPQSFTDYEKDAMFGNSHHKWSFALSNTGAEIYIGQLHQNNYKVNNKVLYNIKFFSDRYPDQNKVYNIRNKKFSCVKLEMTLTSKGIDKIINGYFYEIQ